MRVVIGEKRRRVVGLHLPKAFPLDGSLDGGGFKERHHAGTTFIATTPGRS
jgi:hypothetical protein